MIFVLRCALLGAVMPTAQTRKSKHIVYAPMRYAVVLCRYCAYSIDSRAFPSNETQILETVESLWTSMERALCPAFLANG